MPTPLLATLYPVGRALLASLFVLGAVSKLTSYEATAARMDAAGVPGAALPLVIALELGGGGLVAAGRWGAAYAALVLTGYTLVVNLVFHPFWRAEDAMRAVELSLFFKNVSIAGGLVMLAGLVATTKDEAASGRVPHA